MATLNLDATEIEMLRSGFVQGVPIGNTKTYQRLVMKIERAHSQAMAEAREHATTNGKEAQDRRSAAAVV